jgi:hypothetical protein
MAFNPFDIFRRNQRILFAVLTVVVMFMFVLSFGQGDFFSMVPKLLSQRARTGEVLAEVGGRKVYSSEMSDLERRRLLANEYMVEMARRALGNLEKSAVENMATATAQNKQALQQVMEVMAPDQSTGIQYLSRDMRQRLSFVRFGLPQPSEGEILADRERTMAFTNFSLKQIAEAKAAPEADRKSAEAFRQLIDLDQRLRMATARGRPQSHYFGNQPGDTTRDNLEFLLWLKKADDLGIDYTTADLSRLMTYDLHNRVSAEDFAAVETAMRGKVRFTPALIAEALADEFRVRTAQAAVMGQAATNPLAPQYESPAGYFEFFRKQTDPATYKVISVPAANYLDKVQGIPDEATRRDIFQAGKNEDPDPSLARLGLREPRKLKLGWLEVKGDEPYFQAAAADAAPKVDAAARLAFALAATVPGVGVADLLAAVAPAAAPDLLTADAYRAYAAGHQMELKRAWFDDLFGNRTVPDTALVKPVNAAALVSALAGSLATAGSPLTAPAVLAGSAVLADRRTRLETLPPALIAPVAPGLGGLVTALGDLAVQNVAAQPLPTAAVRERLLNQYRDRLRLTIARTDVDKLAEALVKLKPGPNSPEAQKLVTDFATAHGLKTGGSTEFRDQYAMDEDPGLKALKDRKDESNPEHAAARATVKFGERFFFERVQAPGGQSRVVPSSGFYRPQPYPNNEFPLLLAWRTEEQAAEPLRDINSPAGVAKVEAAWRLREARELAKKAAADLATQATKLGGNPVEAGPKLAQLWSDFAHTFATPAAQQRVKFFTLDGVAPVVERAAVGIMPQKSVGGFTMTPDDNIPYPTSLMATELVKEKDKPLGTSFVVADAPGDTFYVAVLANRQEKSVSEFFTYVYGALAAQTPLQPIVNGNHRAELTKEERDLAVALLKSEYGYANESARVNRKSAGDE